MVNTYTDWAKEIVGQLGKYGAEKLIKALNDEITKMDAPDELEEIDEDSCTSCGAKLYWGNTSADSMHAGLCHECENNRH